MIKLNFNIIFRQEEEGQKIGGNDKIIFLLFVEEKKEII